MLSRHTRARIRSKGCLRSACWYLHGTRYTKQVGPGCSGFSAFDFCSIIRHGFLFSAFHQPQGMALFCEFEGSYERKSSGMCQKEIVPPITIGWEFIGSF